MEVRFFAPGGCVANLDFVESIFGNGGDPFLAENDAGLDIEHWTGHTGCVIVAPHLAGTPKQILNLPSKSNASEREIRDGMYYEHLDELYNDGGAFKLTFRDSSGLVVTVIADNYFGYCKKEVRHRLVFPLTFLVFQKKNMLGVLLLSQVTTCEEFDPLAILPSTPHTFEDTLETLGISETQTPEGAYCDPQFPSIVFLPENAKFSFGNSQFHGPIKVIPKQCHLYLIILMCYHQATKLK